MLPIPVTAPVNAMVPVPELIVMLLVAPAMARATVMFALLALLSSVKSECKVTGIELPKVITPLPDVLVVVAMVPPILSADGIVGAKAPPEYAKASLAESPIVRLPVVSNAVVVEKLAIELLEPKMLKL
ncbi:hypothetical protein PHIN9_13200 [Polynucleobacter sp. HIN9]|nr:hypothetical protein PHIN9_13200 [Polynucleobacter sp. HIN9]